MCTPVQERVRSDLKQWLSWLRQDVGFDGIRLDFSKGYGGQYVKVRVQHYCTKEPRALLRSAGRHWTLQRLSAKQQGSSLPAETLCIVGDSPANLLSLFPHVLVGSVVHICRCR